MIHGLQRMVCRAALVLSIATIVGCSTNPVTGASTVSMMSAAEERKVGQQNYGPMQQQEGGQLTRHASIQRYVNEVGQKVARHADRQFDWEFVVLNNTSANAWALPGGKIAINRGLLTELGSEAELAAVLGHEAVHAAAAHGAQSMGRSQLLNIGAVLAAIAVKDSEYRNLAMTGIGMGAAMINSKYGRSAEYEADQYGIKYMAAAGYDPAAAVHLQETFVRLSKDRKSNSFSRLFASHPPSQDRVNANRKHAAQYPNGGRMGANHYQRMMAPLHKEKAAFKLYDEGVKAYSSKNFRAAEQKARQAQKMIPAESNFYTLLGAALMQQGDKQGAVNAFSSAIKRDKTFYRPYMMRGQVYASMGRKAESQRDLEAAYRLFPSEQIKKMYNSVRMLR